MKVGITRITRGFDRKISFSAPGGNMVTVSAPTWLTADVEGLDDVDSEKVKEISRRLYRLARNISLSDLSDEYGGEAGKPIQMPRTGGNRDDDDKKED